MGERALRERMGNLLSEAESGAMPMKQRLDAAMALVADAWDQGAAKASPHRGAFLRSFYAENPYRDLSEAGGRVEP